MAKKGSASATIGLDYSAFEAGAKAVMKISEQMGSFIRDTLAVAAGNILASAFTRGTGAVTSFFAALKDNLDAIFSTGEELANLAHATGMATGEYLKFKTAAEKNITMSEAAKLLGNNAAIMEKDAGIFRDISLKLFGVGERIQGFWLGVADKIAPVINPLLDRLLSLDLSSWGQAFATPIANAVAIIAQLAMDGTLWQTMGDLAAAAFTYAAEILGKVLKIFTVKGFMEGVAMLWDAIKALGAYMADVFSRVFNKLTKEFAYYLLSAANACANVIDQITVVLGDTLNKLIKYNTLGMVDTRAGVMDQKDAERNKMEREAYLQAMLKVFQGDQPGKPATPAPAGGLVEQIMEAISSTQFGTPELMDRIAKALEKFQTQTSPGSDKNSNTAATQNFGVSSLAAVGGGGGVGFVSLTEHAAQQTSIQTDILETLKSMANKTPGPESTPPVMYKSSMRAEIR
jgi:hypothetical protein